MALSRKSWRQTEKDPALREPEESRGLGRLHTAAGIPVVAGGECVKRGGVGRPIEMGDLNPLKGILWVGQMVHV